MRADFSIARLTRGLVAVLALVALAACAGRFGVDYSAPLGPEVTRSIRVSKVEISVPDSLTVSDRDVLVPVADIVWHGEAPGDRRKQVKSIFDAAAKKAVQPLRGGRRAVLKVTVAQFHGVTPLATLQSPQAVHNIVFTAQLVDAKTGEAIAPATRIRADLAAIVGEDALEMQRKVGGGFLSWQKARVTSHLVAVFKSWLGIGPDVRGDFTSLGR